MREGEIANPVSLTQTMSNLGLGLSRAHQVVNHLTDGEMVRTPLNDSESDVPLILGTFGVDAVRR